MMPIDRTNGESGQPKMPVSGLLSRAAATIVTSSITVALGASAASSTCTPSSSSMTPRRSTRPSESRPTSAESCASGKILSGPTFATRATIASTSVSSRWAAAAGRVTGSSLPMVRMRSMTSRFFTFCVHVVGVDLLPVGQRDHVLLPAMQPEEPIVVELPEVAGVEPLAVERGARGLVVLPVADEDVRPLREHLAVVGDLDLDARHGHADR